MTKRMLCACVVFLLSAFTFVRAEESSPPNDLDKAYVYDILAHEMDVVQKSDSLEISSVTRFTMNEGSATQAVFFLSVSCKVNRLELDGNPAQISQKKDALNRAIKVDISPNTGPSPVEHALSAEYVCRTHPFYGGKQLAYFEYEIPAFVIQKDGTLITTDGIFPAPGNSRDKQFSLALNIRPAPGYLPIMPFTEMKGTDENPEFSIRRSNQQYPIRIELAEGYRIKSERFGNLVVTGIVKKDTLDENDLSMYLRHGAFTVGTLSSLFGPLNDDNVFLIQNVNDNHDGDFSNNKYYPVIYLVKDHLLSSKEEGHYLFCTAHEMTHWWFPSIVWTDESDSAMRVMSEGTASYGEQMVFESAPYGQNRVARLTQRAQVYAVFASGFGAGEERPLSNLGADEKFMAYWKGFMMYHALRYIVGDQTFRNIMKRFVSEYRERRFRLADFFRICEEESGIDLSWYFDAMFYTTKHLDVGIKSASEVKEGDNRFIKIVFENKGDFIFEYPIDMRILNEDGSVITNRMRIMAGETEFKQKIGKMARPKVIELDPFSWIPDVNRTNNLYFLRK